MKKYQSRCKRYPSLKTFECLLFLVKTQSIGKIGHTMFSAIFDIAVPAFQIQNDV